jgi:hypothetical protein
MTLQEMKDAIAKLQEQIAKMEEPKPKTVKRWRAHKGSYYYVGAGGAIGTCREILDGVDDHRYNIGNYFKTEEEAEAYRDKLIRIQAIKDRIAELNRGWEPRFKCNNCNYAFYMNNKNINIQEWRSSQNSPKWAYFKSHGIGEQLKEEFGNDLFLLFE